MVMGVFEQVDSELHNESNHLIVQLSLFVHVDGKVWLIC